MKKYLFSALALPLLFACSSDDLIEKEVASNDQFPGIEKVDATFSMDEGAITRFDYGGGFTAEEGDLWGFAWLTDAYTGLEADAAVAIDGKAYQNHNLIQTDGIFKPQTSIYVGKYFLYRPYDETTVSPQEINFSLAAQPMAEGYESTKQPWKDLAKTAINIGDKWTEVTPTGYTVAPDPTVWNKAGIKQHYAIYGAFFSNQTGLDLTYTNNNPEFGDAGQPVLGATDIDYTETGSAGAADIYGATVRLFNAANSFTYGPVEEPNAAAHNGEFWADKKASQIAGFTFAEGDGSDVITLTAPTGSPIGTGNEGDKGWFWFNSLPVTGQEAATVDTKVAATVKTSYGTVSIKKIVDQAEEDYTVGECAWAFEKPTATATAKQWGQLVANADAEVVAPADGKSYKYSIGRNTFINQFGNHKGKYVFNVDFSKAVMDIHIVNDAHLQKYLKFYLASGKNNGANLVLDGDANHEFKLSKISIALLQTINRLAGQGPKVKVAPCTIADDVHNAFETKPVKIIVTQDGQTGDLAAKKAVPALNDVFATKAVFENDEVDVAPVPVYLSKDCDWTWGSEIGTEGNGILPIDEQVASITNEGTLTVTNTNVQLSVADRPLYNSAMVAGRTTPAIMNFTAVTTVKNPLTNWGEINVSAGAELRAYGIAITNDAKTLPRPYQAEGQPVIVGVINNSGVVGVTYNSGAGAEFNNYGLIDMKTQTAMTLLTRNQTPTGDNPENPISTFKKAFNAENNKLGTVILPENNPFAIVSVSNAPETGFVKYRWNGGATYATPEKPGGIVKYNTVIVSSDIEIAAVEDEIQYIEFDSNNLIHFTNPQNAEPKYLNNLRGIIVTDGTKVLVEKTNEITCNESAYLGAGATIYNGGVFAIPNADVNNVTKVVTNYLGTWSTDQVVVYGN